MSQFLPIKHKTVPLGTYQIVSGSRRVCLVQDKNDPLVADSLISESDCASWNIVQTPDTDPPTYTIENVCWYGRKAWSKVPSENGDKVKGMKLNNDVCQWSIRKSVKTTTGYYITPADHMEWFWSFATSAGTSLTVTLSEFKDSKEWELRKVAENSPNISAPLNNPTPLNKSTPSNNPPSGSQPKAVEAVTISLDIGTKYSAISFATDNGEVKPVTWQDSGVAQTFVPTRYYVENGVIVHGYTRPTDSSIPAKEEFKVDLHDSDALPHEYKTWLELLLKDAKDQIIQESSEKHWSNRRLVFTIPNNWEMSKRAGLAQAITNIKWVENVEHIKFLMESEAAVHYALNQHKLPELKVGMDIIICDIGYSSNDIALYNVSSLNPLKLREKPRQQPTSDIDPGLPEANIILGVIEDDSSWPDLVDNSLTHIKEQIKALLWDKNRVLFLGGGFVEHKRIFDDLHDTFKEDFVRILHTNPQKPNAVADGGIYWHRKPLVEAHAADRFYGIEVWVRHPDPNKRPVGEREIVQSGGEKFIRYGFRVLLDGDEVFLDGETKPKFNFSHAVDKSHFDVKAELYSAERGADTHWVRDAKGNLNTGYKLVGSIAVPYADYRDNIETKGGKSSVHFKCELSFEGVNLRAIIIWKNGKKTHAPLKQ